MLCNPLFIGVFDTKGSEILHKKSRVLFFHTLCRYSIFNFLLFMESLHLFIPSFEPLFSTIILPLFTIVFSTSSFADGGLRFLEKNLEIINNEKSKGCEEN